MSISNSESANDLAFFFEEHGATVSGNTLGAFGNSEVTVTVGNLEFQFAKNDRDQGKAPSIQSLSRHDRYDSMTRGHDMFDMTHVRHDIHMAGQEA